MMLSHLDPLHFLTIRFAKLRTTQLQFMKYVCNRILRPPTLIIPSSSRKIFYNLCRFRREQFQNRPKIKVLRFTLMLADIVYEEASHSITDWTAHLQHFVEGPFLNPETARADLSKKSCTAAHFNSEQ